MFANNYKTQIPVDINYVLDEYFLSMTSEPQSIETSFSEFAFFLKKRYGKDQRITVKLDALYDDSQFIHANFASGAARFVDAGTTGGAGESDSSYTAFIEAVSDYDESKDQSDTERYGKLKTVISSMNAFVFSTNQTGGGGWGNAIACQPGFFRRVMRFIMGTFVSVGASESPPTATTAILAGGSVGLASQNVGSLEEDARKKTEAAEEVAAAAEAARLKAENELQEAKAAQAAAERKRREEEKAAEMKHREAEKAANIRGLEDAARAAEIKRLQEAESKRQEAEKAKAAEAAEKARRELAEAAADAEKARRELAEAAADAEKARRELAEAAAVAEKARRELAEAAAVVEKARMEKLKKAAADAEKASRELAEAAAAEKRREQEKAAAVAVEKRWQEEKAAAEAEKARREEEAKKQLQNDIEIARIKKEKEHEIFKNKVKGINEKRHNRQRDQIKKDSIYTQFQYTPNKHPGLKRLKHTYVQKTKHVPRDWNIRPLKKHTHMNNDRITEEYKITADAEFDNAVKFAEEKFNKAFEEIDNWYRDRMWLSQPEKETKKKKTIESLNDAYKAYNEIFTQKKSYKLTPARRQYAYNTDSDVRSLLAVLENTKDSSFASHMLLSQLWDQNNVKYRIFTACFLYFITTADVTDIDDFNFMVPVYLSAAKNAIRKQVAEILELYSKNEPYLAVTEAQTYDMYPHEGLFWHELVNGLLTGNLLCCVPKEKQSEIKQMFDKNASYTMNSYARYLIDFMKSNHITCSADNKLWQIQCEALDVRPLVKRQTLKSDISDENVAFLCNIHGSIPSNKIITIPFNVTLVKLGMCTKYTRMSHFKFGALCDNKNKDLDLTNIDVLFGGCEIVIPGCTYPEISLGTQEFPIERCDDRIDLDPSKSVQSLSQLLDLVSNNVSKKQQHALVYMSACQRVHSKDPHKDMLTTALSNAFPALARGPTIIYIKGNNRLNVPKAVRESALLRANKNDTPNDIVYKYLKRGGGDRRGGIWVGIVIGIATTITVAFLQ